MFPVTAFHAKVIAVLDDEFPQMLVGLMIGGV